VRSLTPIELAAVGMLMGSASRTLIQRSKAATVGSLCARALGMI